jgi:oxygen-independent coproporphyrinogen-3 oxidase
MSFTIDKATIAKFDVPGPRYTSYPTAPVWSDEVDEGVYQRKLAALGASDKTLSLYIHIPFCQSLCSYCGCNVVVREEDERFGDEYLKFLFIEIDLVRKYLGVGKKVLQCHWGGGTPTFLSGPQTERLYGKVQENFDIDPCGEIAIEVDARTVSHDKIRQLREAGFNRVSIGVQDFNEDVQKEVNRLQPFEMVQTLMDWCRQLKFQSVNFDLIYGLPRQTPESFGETVDQVIGLKPDRIALYSFAYVPWLKRHQKKIDESLMPSNDMKLDIFLTARREFLDAGYQAIAMDHFALRGDELAKAFDQGKLYRNFMGYTVKPADEYIGLGVTAIGFLQNTYVQNHKALPNYYRALKQNRLPVERGKVLTGDDQIRQWVINALMSQFHLDKSAFERKFGVEFDRYFDREQEHIRQCARDGLLEEGGGRIKVTELGKLFVRNVCMGFDYYLRHEGANRKFSRTV